MNAEDQSEQAPEPGTQRRVKRGAFPVRQSDIDQADVFVPPGVEHDDDRRSETGRSETGRSETGRTPAAADNDEKH